MTEVVKGIKSTYTKEFIQNKLMTENSWVERSLIKLYEKQTLDEQRVKETKYQNKVGFNSSDSPYLSYCSQYVLSGRSLSGHHLEKCRGKLMKYWKQILGFIIERQTQ